MDFLQGRYPTSLQTPWEETLHCVRPACTYGDSRNCPGTMSGCGGACKSFPRNRIRERAVFFACSQPNKRQPDRGTGPKNLHRARRSKRKWPCGLFPHGKPPTPSDTQAATRSRSPSHPPPSLGRCTLPQTFFPAPQDTWKCRQIPNMLASRTHSCEACCTGVRSAPYTYSSTTRPIYHTHECVGTTRSRNACSI